ncbi:MAG: hypothetical protein KDK23_05105 [Leptospiraceae bacterium]|nr:hypothetical protein [Leptospiraceae bacterium]
MNSIFTQFFSVSFLLSLSLFASGCVKEYPDQPLAALAAAGTDRYSLSVTVEGLQDSGLVLVNGSSTLALNSSGTFAFPDTFVKGSSYNVILQSVPAGYQCNATNTSGTLSADVSNVRVDCLRWATITPDDTTVLGPAQPIRVVFTRSMTGCAIDTTTTPPASNLGTQVGTVNLLTTNVANDTLEFIPSTTWSTGTLKFLFLNGCQSADSTVSMAINLNYIVTGNAAYVSTSGVDAGMCNTVAGACATVNYAINQLQVNFGCNGAIDCAVLVAEGPVNSSPPHFRATYDMAGNAISMANRISLLGSFSQDFTSRNVNSRTTILTGNGGPCSGLSCHILVPGSVSSLTLLEGFTIVGDESGAANSSGIQVNGSIRLTNNHIQAGNGTVLRVALNLSGAAISLVTGNRIETGDNGALTARAIVLNSGSVDLYRNQILTGGATMAAEAIVLLGGGGNIHTNGIYTGIAPVVTGIAINFAGSYDIVHNLILADQATGGASAGIHFVAGPTNGRVLNNMIIGSPLSVQSFCMRDALGLPATVHLDGNNLYGCITALMENSGGIPLTTICSAGTPAARGTFGTATCVTEYINGGTVDNLSQDPAFQDASNGNFYYSANSPCSVAQGGTDPITYTLVVRPDADMRARPGADTFHSIGPFEPFMGCL